MLILIVPLLLAACAFGGFGRDNLENRTPEFAPGTSKREIIERLGPPDKQVALGDREYLAYRAKKGYFVVVFGQTSVNDYEITLREGRLESARWVPVGSSFGIFAPQGAVAE
jgi:hypothetical protein